MAPIFVGSENENSRVRSDRLGFAASTSDPGTAAEGDGYYNSTDNQLKFYDGSSWSAIQGSGSVELVASGTLANGQTVIVTSDGKVAGVTTTQITQTVGSISNYSPTSVESFNFEGVYHSGVEKMVIAYKKNPDQHGYAVVGKISDTTISYSTTATEFYDNTMEYPTIVYDSNSDRIVIAFTDHQNYARAIVGTVNADDTITFGTSVKFGDPAVQDITGRYFSGVFDSANNKVVFAFQHINNSDRGSAIVGTVDPSDNSITFGSPTTFETGRTYDIAATYDSTNSKVVIAYRDSNNSHRGKAIVGAVSGTSISFGGEQTFETGGAYSIGIAYDSDNSKVIIAYRDSGDSDDGKAVVGTVDPSSNSISYGSIVTFSDGYASDNHVAYDEAAQKVVITFRDHNPFNAEGKYQLGTISGTSISFDYAVDSAPTFNAYTSWNPTVVYDPSSKRNLIIYNDTNNSDYQTTRVLRNAFVDTNLTSENFIGFSDAAYTDGQTANIQIISSIDDAQSGLTTGSLHYVQNDGSLSTTAGNPSIEAGTALSDTKIRIKS